MKKIIKIIKSNLRQFGIRYVFWDIMYHIFNFIYTEFRGKKRKKLKPEFVKVKVNDYEMIINKNGKGIEKDLLLNKTREPISTKIMKTWCTPGSVVLDIGANIGYYTILAAKNVGKKGKVYAIEPAKYSYSLLKKNIKLNNLKNVKLYNIAFGDYNGKLKIYIEEASNYNSPIPVGKKNEIEVVPCYKIDTFFKKMKRKPDIIKIDVEGYEYNILKGAEKTLNHVEKIFVELHFPLIEKEKMISLLKMLKNKGFKLKKMVLEWERNVDENCLLGKLVNWLYRRRSKPKIYTDISIDKLMNSDNILNGHLSYEAFFEKIKK